jgi:mRNA interferase MazF
MSGPSRGEIWNADLDPTRGREQAGRRPVLVVSTNAFNHGPAELVVVLPVTTKDKRIPWHVPVKSGSGGLTRESFVMCEAVRCVSCQRLFKRLGAVPPSVIEEAELRLRMLLEL